MKIGYLGPVNSFTYQAAKHYFSADLKAFATIPQALDAVLAGAINFALVPVENSLEGSVHATIDSMSVTPDLFVYEEVVLPIKQQLLGYHATPEKIYSHPQALAQCQKFLAHNFPNAELIASASTTRAVQFIKERPDEPIAAIASIEAANYYDVPVLAENIQDTASNETRFWLVGQVKQPPEKILSPQKMSIILQPDSNLPGSLHKMLACFGWRNINLSKIESRPLKTNLGEYFFVVDIILNHNEKLIENALEEITLLNGTYQILGKYGVAKEK